jgi:4'-phosphopantetheinyl transferase EntD
VLAQILPPQVVSAELFGEPRAGGLLPAEQAAVANAVELRRREYATVRRCARSCLRRLGYGDQPILAGEGGAPGWPAGVRGSMTHCDGYAAAAVVAARLACAIGIDAEPDAPLPDGVLDLVATPAEKDRVSAMPGGPGEPRWDRLLFSAKEALFKAWSPLVGQWLEPGETQVVLGPRPGRFTAVVSPRPTSGGRRLGPSFHGRWARDRGILVTAVVVAGR